MFNSFSVIRLNGRTPGESDEQDHLTSDKRASAGRALLRIVLRYHVSLGRYVTIEQHLAVEEQGLRPKNLSKYWLT
jgi:hypothetical protein